MLGYGPSARFARSYFTWIPCIFPNCFCTHVVFSQHSCLQHLIACYLPRFSNFNTLRRKHTNVLRRQQRKCNYHSHNNIVLGQQTQSQHVFARHRTSAGICLLSNFARSIWPRSNTVSSCTINRDKLTILTIKLDLTTNLL